MGTVSRAGAMSLAWSMDKLGPMARTARDCAIVLSVICGVDAADATTVEWSFRPTRRKTFTLGVLPEDFGEIPDVEKRYDDAIAVLRRSGMKLRAVDLPKHDWGATARVVLNAEQAAAHEELIRSERLDELVDEGQKEGLRASVQQPGQEYSRALERRVAMTRDIRALFREVDALVGPTLVAEAPPIEQDLRQLRRGFGPAVLGAIAGIPQVTVPMGPGSNGMPLGLSFSGDLFSEATLVAMAMAYQRATDHHLKRPPDAVS